MCSTDIGRTYVPASAATASGMEVYGYIVFVAALDPLDEPTDFAGHADFTEQTAEQNPDWELALPDEVTCAWHGVGAHPASHIAQSVAAGSAVNRAGHGRPRATGGARRRGSASRAAR